MSDPVRQEQSQRELPSLHCQRYGAITAAPQGYADFMALEWTLCGAAVLIAFLFGEESAIFIGLALFAAGLPHGFVKGTQTNPRLRSVAYWVAYVAVSALVLAAFLLVPSAALTGFLGISLVHFALSDALPSRATNIAVACLAVGGSTLFQPQTTAMVLDLIAGKPLPGILLHILRVVGLFGVLFAVAAVLAAPMRNWPLLLAIAMLATLHPVLAVGAIFYLFHAAPIQSRIRTGTFRHSHIAVLCIALAAAIAGSLATAARGSLDETLIALVSAGAIALIAPHLFEDLLDRYRHSNHSLVRGS